MWEGRGLVPDLSMRKGRGLVPDLPVWEDGGPVPEFLCGKVGERSQTFLCVKTWDWFQKSQEKNDIGKNVGDNMTHFEIEYVMVGFCSGSWLVGHGGFCSGSW